MISSSGMLFGFATGYIIIAFLLVAGGIALAICVGIHTWQCCCCCKRSDEAPAAANPIDNPTHATMEMGGIDVVVNVPNQHQDQFNVNGVVTVKATAAN